MELKNLIKKIRITKHIIRNSKKFYTRTYKINVPSREISVAKAKEIAKEMFKYKSIINIKNIKI